MAPRWRKFSAEQRETLVIKEGVDMTIVQMLVVLVLGYCVGVRIERIFREGYENYDHGIFGGFRHAKIKANTRSCYESAFYLFGVAVVLSAVCLLVGMLRILFSNGGVVENLWWIWSWVRYIAMLATPMAIWYAGSYTASTKYQIVSLYKRFVRRGGLF